MRILAITNLYPTPYQPRRAPFNHQQFRRLAARHPLRVIAPISWTDELTARRERRGRLPENRRGKLDEIVVEYPRFCFPPKVLRGQHGHCFQWSIRRAFERALAEFAPDLVLATWAYPDGWASVRLGHQAGLPVVIKVHGSDILTLRRDSARQRRTSEALRRAEGIIVVSQDLARWVIELGAEPDRVQVVYNGVDSEVFHPGSQQEARCRLGVCGDEPIVLFVGHLEPVKGLDFLIEACARVARSGVRFRCYLIGHGSMETALRRQIARSGLEERVRLVGPRPQVELADWYRAADVLVLPSRSEGFPNVLLEATACGLPFVASRVGGIPEIAEHTAGRLFPVGDVDQQAESLREALAEAPRCPVGLDTPQRDHEQAVSELEDLFTRVLLVQRASINSPSAHNAGS
jgi:glycosyltransferase involved in cell wall biosynthesis